MSARVGLVWHAVANRQPQHSGGKRSRQNGKANARERAHRHRCRLRRRRRRDLRWPLRARDHAPQTRAGKGPTRAERADAGRNCTHPYSRRTRRGRAEVTAKTRRGNLRSLRCASPTPSFCCNRCILLYCIALWTLLASDLGAAGAHSSHVSRSRCGDGSRSSSSSGALRFGRVASSEHPVAWRTRERVARPAVSLSRPRPTTDSTAVSTVSLA